MIVIDEDNDVVDREDNESSRLFLFLVDYTIIDELNYYLIWLTTSWFKETDDKLWLLVIER